LFAWQDRPEFHGRADVLFTTEATTKKGIRALVCPEEDNQEFTRQPLLTAAFVLDL
jgi:hypothetical protein